MPLEPGQVRIYSCGPTVYDHIHVGNLSSFITADMLHRVLRANGYKIKHVMNFTDVDDKTIQRSHEQYPDNDSMQALQDLTRHYSEIFLSDMAAIGNDIQSLIFAKATDNVDKIQNLIKELYKKGFAYLADDGIYFSIDAYIKSGKKYGQLLKITTENTGQARIANDEYDKDHVHDFALWKLQKSDEPAWDFELDGHNLLGRPGWHVECSVMSSDNLGQPFDIHTGGVDLMFPHHENEIAQSTAGQDNPLYAKYFVHNEHLLVDGHKMSKSLNNFYTLRDIVEKGYEPLAFRVMALQGSYRNQSNFTWENLVAAQNRLQSFQAMVDLKWQANDKAKVTEREFVDAKEAINQALTNNLDTPSALTELSQLEQALNNGGLNTSSTEAYNDFINWLDEVLGLGLAERTDITSEQRQMISERETARNLKDWQKADELRNSLKEQNIELNDTELGPIWFRSS